jgi:hypothetical protein
VFVGQDNVFGGTPKTAGETPALPITGKLSRGDTIYVAIGPGETDSDDAFGLDFTIAR